jgi:hypothetical protein
MMRIVRSTSSHASAGGRNETRETRRFGAIQAKGATLPDDDGVSPNPARGELVSASLNHHRRQTSQKRGSLPPTGKKRNKAPAGPVGVRGVGAHQKNPQVTWETRSGGCHKQHLAMGMHNHRQCPGRESEGLVVILWFAN